MGSRVTHYTMSTNLDIWKYKENEDSIEIHFLYKIFSENTIRGEKRSFIYC